ncbi:transposase [Streptomyces sp. NPDC051643]|uniref:transposase n=1 Tax=Streptomyces sp. NPDC051643 TaxID=3365665 RepID=UPI00379E59B6
MVLAEPCLECLGGFECDDLQVLSHPSSEPHLADCHQAFGTASDARGWRKNIRYVAIDLSTTYRAAVRTGLPGTVVVVDHFHIVQLANKIAPPATRPR